MSTFIYNAFAISQTMHFADVLQNSVINTSHKNKKKIVTTCEISIDRRIKDEI